MTKVLAFMAAAIVINSAASARPTISNTQRTTAGSQKGNGLLKTAAECNPALAIIDLDINNVRARLMTGGDMWWDRGTGEARYEVPINSRKNSLFAGAVWIGGIDAQGQLKVAAQTYRQSGNDYWPGPLNQGADSLGVGASNIDQATCADWDRFWKVNATTINRFRELQNQGDVSRFDNPDFQSIVEWPARGNGSGAETNGQPVDYKAKGTSGSVLAMDRRDYAPFVDVDGNGLYEPQNLDYPKILGDQYIWWVYNDKGNVKTQTGSESIGMEIQASAFAFSAKNAMNDATFYNYKLINRSLTRLDSTFISVWTDADLGWYNDDFIGCDTSRDLGILYNGLAVDGNGQANEYGDQLPMVAVDFFVGPIVQDTVNGVIVQDTLGMEAFTYFNNTDPNPSITDPANATQFYYYMTGSNRTGQRFKRDADDKCTGLSTGPDTKTVFDGDPTNPQNTWTECSCGNTPADRRFIHSAGPFRLESGASNDVTIGVVWAANTGGCNADGNVSFRKIKAADDLAQQLFESGFRPIAPPEAPRLVIKEMDNKLVCYLVNDAGSNNYKEQYGYNTDSAKYRVAVPKAKKSGSIDTLYKFEGYRVFQLKNAQVQPAQIVNERGEVDQTVAKEVFQTDIQNGVSQLVNFEKSGNINNCDNCYESAVKVSGKDSGIVHTFEITTDGFATGQRTSLVNYKTYYFVAVAYASNNFDQFDPNNPESTQDIQYLESDKSANGAPLEVITAMPNPTGINGTTLNADFNQGVIIKKLTGVGNGKKFLQLSQESEDEAIATSFSKQPTYVGGAGPADIRVIDPARLAPGNWELYINGDTSQAPPYVSGNSGFIANKATWWLIKDGNQDTIYAERNLDMLNEQILESYGLSVNIEQANLPGSTAALLGENGYIGSDITFTDPNKTWLGGLNDGDGASPYNWIRAGKNEETDADGCDYRDILGVDPEQKYENMLANNTGAARTWGPYQLGVGFGADSCGLETTNENATVPSIPLSTLQSVDVVYTSDRSKWSRCVVLEMQSFPVIAEGRARRLSIRKHASWTGDVDGNGAPIYGALPGDAVDSGMSWFPGYAINQETGERLNIIFGEDSWLKAHNGTDMIWNPSSTLIDNDNNNVFGGRHYIYVTRSRYDSCRVFAAQLSSTNSAERNRPFEQFIWTSIPAVNPGYSLLSLRDGLIPTETRVRLRVERPYNRFVPEGIDLQDSVKNQGYPLYTFNTTDLAPTLRSDLSGLSDNEKDNIMNKIKVVPNPYYAYASYERTRLDTRVRITNLPRKATINIYSVDGSLVRRFNKDDASVSYLDWDVRNAKGLPIASGMYMIHVQADGVGDKVIKWFGATRPTDIATFQQ